VSLSIGIELSQKERYGETKYVTTGEFAGCYANSKYKYYVCSRIIILEDCTYTYDWDFNKRKNAFFWRCYDD